MNNLIDLNNSTSNVLQTKEADHLSINNLNNNLDIVAKKPKREKSDNHHFNLQPADLKGKFSFSFNFKN